jgi:hypothetical protein
MRLIKVAERITETVAAIVSTGYIRRIFTLPAKIGSEAANTCLSWSVF